MDREGPDETQEGFQRKKREYFVRLGLRLRQAFSLHKEVDVWRNVSEHCLVEAARAQQFARLLGLNPHTTQNLLLAAALHDFFKKGEKDITARQGLTREAFTKAVDASEEIMREKEIDEKVIHLVHSVGDSAIPEAESLLAKKVFSDDEIAWLVIHYIDDCTIDAEWARSGDLDRRIDRNEANPCYARLNEEGKKVFGGETAYQAQRRVGHLIEVRLTELVAERSGHEVAPKSLPEFIDSLIRSEIEKSSA